MTGAPGPAAAQRANDQTAMSVPRPATSGGIPGLPQVLAPSDAARLRRVFDLQSRGDLAAAAREADRLDDRRLMGHVLADRYLRAEASTGAPEVQSWLAQYADHPGALRLHDLLGRLLPRGAALPAPPDRARAALARGRPGAGGPHAPPRRRPAQPGARPSGARPGAGGQCQRRPRPDRPDQGDQPGLCRRCCGPTWRSACSAPARTRTRSASPPRPPAPASASGLRRLRRRPLRLGARPVRHRPALFRARRPQRPGAACAAAPPPPSGPPAPRSGARKPQLYVSWMMQAAQEPRTFYGLVARRTLGLGAGFAWEGELAGEAEAAADRRNRRRLAGAGPAAGRPDRPGRGRIAPALGPGAQRNPGAGRGP